MTGRAKVRGFDLLARRLDPDPALSAALMEAGEDVVRQARSALAGEGADRALMESVTTAVTPSGVEIGSAHPAARAAEFGSLASPARPFLHPAFQAALGPLKARLRQTLKTHVRQPKRRTP